MKILLSYHYFKNVDIAQLCSEVKPEAVFCDSGAFSAKSLGVGISLDDYIAFLHRHKKHFAVYAGLDVIGDIRQTIANQKEMERQGLSPIPVVHYGTPNLHIADILERYDYVALGAMVGLDKKEIAAFCHHVFRTKPNRTRIHGFGMTRWDILKRFPFYSVDSSSWLAGARYGRVALFDPNWGKWHKIDLYDIKTAYKHQDLLRFYGVSPNTLGIKKRYNREDIVGISGYSWILAEQWLNKRVYLANNRKSLYKEMSVYLAHNGSHFKDLSIYLADDNNRGWKRINKLRHGNDSSKLPL